MILEVTQKKKICCFKNDKILANFDLISKNSQSFYLDWFLLCKVYNVWPKVQRIYGFWKWRVLQNLTKHWLVAEKNDMRISQIFSRALESLKLGTFMRSFYPKYKINELKHYRGVTYHGNEEWYKIWRRIDLSFQNWHHNLMNIDHSTQLSQKCAFFWTSFD